MNEFGLIEGCLLLWIQENLRTGWLNGPMRLITSLGNEGIFWIGLIAVLLIFKKTRKVGICCALAMIMTYIAVNLTIKPLVARTRPYVLLDGLEILVSRPGDHSFPSGHSAHSLAVTWVLFRLAKRKYGVPMLVLGVLVALSRLYVGVHFPSDVVCGIIAGILFAQLSISLMRRFKLMQST